MQRHWSVDEKKLSTDPEQHAIWKLEQRINFGMGEPKIKKSTLLKYWDKLDLDPHKKTALRLALNKE